jgi:hypothetical protein
VGALSETGRGIHDLAQPNLTSAYDPIRISAAFNPATLVHFSAQN